MKDFLCYIGYVSSAFLIILSIAVIFGNTSAKNSCVEYGERKNVVVEYKFYSGCWVKSKNEVWDLKSSLESKNK